MKQFSEFGDFLGSYLGDTFALFAIVIFAVIFFWVVLKVIEGISKGATKASGLDPKSEKGQSREFKIGLTLFIAFLIFGLFIAPNINS